MPATLTYSPLTPQNPAEFLRTNTRRYARYAETHPVQPLKGLREPRAASVSYRASVPAGHAGCGVALSYRASSPDGEVLPVPAKALSNQSSVPTPPPPFRHTPYRFWPRHATTVWRNVLKHPRLFLQHATTVWQNLLQNPRGDDYFTFSAKERDPETGLSYFGSRYYSSDLSIWLSVDPMSDKYPSLSPYVYCADNPVKLVDPNGEYLEVADDEDTHNDLLSIVGDTHRDRVIFNKDGSVSVNIEGLSEEALKKDIGLSLINDMVNSDCWYYYETSDDAFFCDESGKRVYKLIASDVYGGVINASRYGTDAYGRHSELPMDKFDGQVVMAKSGRFLLYEQDVRKNIVFHELKENFLRTDEQMNYQGAFGVGAHRTAARIENNAWGNFAGQCVYELPQAVGNKPMDKVLNYLNNGIYR